jgi:hypothetical protein
MLVNRFTEHKVVAGYEDDEAEYISYLVWQSLKEVGPGLLHSLQPIPTTSVSDPDSQNICLLDPDPAAWKLFPSAKSKGFFLSKS